MQELNCENLKNPYHYFKHAERKVDGTMLCTLCRKPLNAMKDLGVIWRTLNKQQQGKREPNKQWAKMPAHDLCVKGVSSEIAKNRILMAAGHPYFEYSKEDPKADRVIQVNEDGQHQVFVSDGVYKMEDFDI